MSIQVLYEDNHLIAVFKPAGLLVQGDRTGDVCLMDKVKDYLKEKYNKPGNVFLGLLHRLDRPVSGIVLFAKTSKGASRLCKQIRERTIKKEYQVLVEGNVEHKKQILKNYLVHNEKNNTTKISNSDVSNSKYAELEYEILEKRKAETILKIILKTGRQHQIRVQLSHIGHPIVGDLKYGAKKARVDRSIALCASSLTFSKATGDEIKTVDLKEIVL